MLGHLVYWQFVLNKKKTQDKKKVNKTFEKDLTINRIFIIFF